MFQKNDSFVDCSMTRRVVEEAVERISTIIGAKIEGVLILISVILYNRSCTMKYVKDKIFQVKHKIIIKS